VAGLPPAIHQAQPLICTLQVQGASAAPDPLRELPSMEFWRTDEIAPVVLIILFELMVLGLINYTMPI
jgi:hypothetical protein